MSWVRAMCMSGLVLVTLVWLMVAYAAAAPQDALVTHLPGFSGTFPSNHYSGYIELDNIQRKNLFYYFVVSENTPAKDPVVLWLNGGPGCSSFDGFIYEHGPFNFAPPTAPSNFPSLHLNPYRWSKVSNIMYLDSPAGAGLSYCDSNANAYNTGDTQTAIDTHNFLLKWFEVFSEYRNNSFYLAGESYAGIYIPMLASEILQGNKRIQKLAINLQGYMIGNGVTDLEIDGNALIPFVYGMGLISDEMFTNTTTFCGSNFFNNTNTACLDQLDKVYKAMGGLNLYDILEPCYHEPGSNASSNLPFSFRQLGRTEKPMGVRKRIFGRAWPYRVAVRPGRVASWPELLEDTGSNVPCVNAEVANMWLNNDGVRKALHAANITWTWVLCTSKINYTSDTGSMIPLHIDLLNSGLRALIFSGDHDMCVPFTGTQKWTRQVGGANIIDEWRSWWVDDQVAGYLQSYRNGLTFLTFKGAGHTVPEYKPKEALHAYNNWLSKESI